MNASISSTPACARRVDHALGLGRGQGQRLLAQDVLAGLGGRDRPLRVEVVGQRDVDRVDLGIGEQRLVGGVGARDAQLGCATLRAGPGVARGDGHDLAAPRLAGCPGTTFLRAMSAVDRIPQRSVGHGRLSPTRSR